MAKKIDVNGLDHYHDKVSAMLASEYSSSKTYAVGDYCFHAGTLYECTTAITTAEAWTSGHWTAAKLAEDTSALKTALNDQIIISETKPVSEDNKIWINSDADSIQVPTVEDLDSAVAAVFPTETITNQAIASLDDGAYNIPVKSLVVDIVSVQEGSGDPSPTNVRSITGWTGANVNVASKNIINWEITTSGPYDTRINGYGNGKWQPKMDIPKSFLGQTFTYSAFFTVPSGATETGNVNVYFYDENNSLITSNNGNTIAVGSSGVSSISFTVPLNTKQYALGIFLPVGAVAEKPMLEYAIIASDYEPYIGTTYPITFPDAAGTVYGGTLTNHGTDEWKLKSVGVKHIFTGNEDASFSSGRIIYKASNFANDGLDYNGKLWCNAFAVINSSSAPPLNCVALYSANGNIIFGIPTSISTLEDAKSYIDSIGTEIIYELANPVEYTITAEAAKTLLGQNNIWADTGNVNTLTYRVDIQKYIEKAIANA